MTLKVLVACEYSGTVRDAFLRRGHDAISCDLLPTESPGPHYQGDVFDLMHEYFHLMIAHPPCTHLCVSGNRWYAGSSERRGAVRFVERLWELPIPMIAVENPVGVLSTQSSMGPPSQYIHPWEFGHHETKKTGLWLKNLPPLMATDICYSQSGGPENRIHYMSPSEDRGKERSRFYEGIAEAMADEWGAETHRQSSAM